MSDPTTGSTPQPDPQKPDVGAVTPAAATTGTTAQPAAKPAPAKPTPPKPGPKNPARRGFFLASWMAVAWTTFSGTMVLMVLGTLRFLFPNVLSEPPRAFKAGFPDRFEEGKVTDDFKDRNAWIVRNEGRIYALSTTCTHLGCTPNWLDREKKFKCPCHGSGFFITGVNFEGPAPRPLERRAIRIGDDGQILVDKSKKFQNERGEWDNPESYIKV